MNVRMDQKGDLGEEKVRKVIETLPGAHALSELRRLANDGNEAAQSELDGLVQSSSELVEAIFDPIRTARKLVTQSIAGDDYLVAKSVEKQLDEKINASALLNSEDPITKMLGECTAIAWLDATRCGVAATRATERKSDRSHFQALADRSYRRLQRITEALRRDQTRASQAQ